jgi:hypothetical protein
MNRPDGVSTLLLTGSWLNVGVAGLALGLAILHLADRVLCLAAAGYFFGMFVTLRAGARSLSWWSPALRELERPPVEAWRPRR